MNRLQQLRYLEEKVELKEKQLSLKRDEIDKAIEHKRGSDHLVKLCGERNILSTDIHYLNRQIENLKDRKCYLGEVVVEVSDSGS